MEMRNKVNFLFQPVTLLSVIYLLLLMDNSRGIVCLSIMLAVCFKYSTQVLGSIINCGTEHYSTTH